jgi:hypothetical protein
MALSATAMNSHEENLSKKIYNMRFNPIDQKRRINDADYQKAKILFEATCE